MSNAVTICVAGPEHETGWLHLWDLYCDGAINDQVTRATWERILNPASAIGAIVAVVAGEVVGFITFVAHECTWEIDPVCYVEDLYVSKQFRGDVHGVGIALAGALQKRFAAGEWSRLYGITRSENVVAQRLYRRFAKGEPYLRYVLRRESKYE